MRMNGVRVLALIFFTTVVWCSATAALAQETIEPRFRYAERWQALSDAENHADAAKLAKTWVADAIVQFGDGAAETFPPLTHLASSYAANDQNQLAIKTYREAIIVGEREIGVFSRLLVGPLVNLSALLAVNEQHDDAVSALMRAKNITHRVEGIFNTEQSTIVEKLSDIYLQLDDVQQATREQRLLYSSEAREVGDDSPAIVPALHRWAEFHVRIDRRRDARRFLRRAVAVLEDAYGRNDVRIAGTLKLIAETFRSDADSTLPREGLQALRRVVAIYQAQENVDQADLLNAQASLGDWYLATGRRALGMKTHVEAIAAARAAGFDDALINDLYTQPKALTTKKQPEGSNRLGLQRMKESWSSVRINDVEGSVVFEFDVNERGFPKNVRVVKDTIGRARLVNTFRSWVNSVIYRPKFVNGEAVVTRGLRREFELQDAES